MASKQSADSGPAAQDVAVSKSDFASVVNSLTVHKKTETSSSMPTGNVKIVNKITRATIMDELNISVSQ